MAKLTREQVIRALRRLERGWPDDLWLFSANGDLCLMEKKDGMHAMTNSLDGGVDEAFVLDRFGGIDNDGGDW
jgi:hypothetical protein